MPVTGRVTAGLQRKGVCRRIVALDAIDIPAAEVHLDDRVSADGVRAGAVGIGEDIGRRERGNSTLAHIEAEHRRGVGRYVRAIGGDVDLG